MYTNRQRFWNFFATNRTSLIILCLLMAGCGTVTGSRQDHKTIDIYDTQGRVKEHVVTQGERITIYDKDWKTKGHGKIAY